MLNSFAARRILTNMSRPLKTPGNIAAHRFKLRSWLLALCFPVIYKFPNHGQKKDATAIYQLHGDFCRTTWETMITFQTC